MAHVITFPHHAVRRSTRISRINMQFVFVITLSVFLWLTVLPSYYVKVCSGWWCSLKMGAWQQEKGLLELLFKAKREIPLCLLVHFLIKCSTNIYITYYIFHLSLILNLFVRFRASLYPCPETPQERKEMASGVSTRIDDLQMVYLISVDLIFLYH